MNLAEAINKGMTIGPLLSGEGMPKLTVKELRQASDDLRSAADELAERGHNKGALINRVTGTVCCLGAIELATYKKQVRVAVDYALSAIDTPDVADKVYRADNAVIVLADTVGHLCECSNNKDDSWGTVSHYNDSHCPGGIVAYNLIRIAAARALVLAEHKHELIKGVMRTEVA